MRSRGVVHAELDHVVLGLGRHEPDAVADAQRAVEHAERDDDAAVRIERRVVDERAHGLGRRASARRRHAVDDGVEDLLDPDPRLGGRGDGVGAVEADRRLDLLGDAIRLGGRQVDLVQHGHDLEVVLEREVDVRHGLRLDALRGVDHEQRALARGEAARDLVREVDVARRVDQVELYVSPSRGLLYCMPPC